MTLGRQVLSKETLRRFLPTLGILIAVIAVLAAFPHDSIADDWHRGHGRGHWNRGESRLHDRIYASVPQRIYVENRTYYRPFFAGRHFYGPHQHYHATYRFPVVVNGVVVYRPYSYCGNHLFVTASVPLPRLAFNLVFGAPIAVYGPAYYAPNPYVDYQSDDWDDDG
ncbi:MAG: hypothetical protein DMH00_11310, partial [Acidobacteria bacterium]